MSPEPSAPVDRWRHRYPLAVPAIGLAAGLVFPQLLFATLGEAALVVVAATVGAVVAVRAGIARLAVAAVAIGFLAVGAFAALPLAAAPLADSIGRLAARAPGPVTLVGRIDEAPLEMPGRASFRLRVTEARARGVPGPAGGRVAVQVYGLPDDGVPRLPWREGNRVEVAGELAAPRDVATPGVPSRRAWLARRGIRALLVVKSPARLRVLEVAPRGPILRLRDHVTASIDTYVAGGAAASRAGAGLVVVPPSLPAAVLAAVLLHDRVMIDPEATRHLVEAGLLHVLAISGLHVGIVAAAVYWLAGLVRCPAGGRCAATIALVWSYVLVAGAPTAALRAAVVTSIVVGGRALRRDAPAGNVLLLAFLIAGVVEPGGIRDAGFQMTFAAATGLLLLARPIAAGRRPRWLWLPLAASVAAQIAVLPVAAAHFGRVSYGGVFLNLVAVPLAGLIVGAGFLLTIAAAVDPGAAAAVATVARWLVEMLLALAEPTGVALSYRIAPKPGWLAVAAGIALLATLASWPRSRAARIAPAAVGLALLAAPWPRPIVQDGGLALHVIDVGQGDAILVELPGGRTLLMDAGGFPRSRFDPGDRFVVPFLLSRGHRRIDVAALSHAHPDHAAGMVAVLRDLAVGELWIGAEPADDPQIRALKRVAARRGTEVRAAATGLESELAAGAVCTLDVLHPPAGVELPSEVDNDLSMVLSIAAQGGSLLLTGDIERRAEAELLRAARVTPVDVLKVAHHGSRTSSGDRFLAAASPRLAVISCGYRNRFGHPSGEVVERLEGAGARVFRTDLDGTISVHVTVGGHLVVTPTRARFGSRQARGVTSARMRTK